MTAIVSSGRIAWCALRGFLHGFLGLGPVQDPGGSGRALHPDDCDAAKARTELSARAASRGRCC